MIALPCEPKLLESPLKTYRIFQTTLAITKSLQTSTHTKFSFQNHSFQKRGRNVHRSGPLHTSPDGGPLTGSLLRLSTDRCHTAIKLPTPAFTKLYPCIFA